MTFEEVRTLARPAFLHVGRGVVLRYDPREGCVRHLVSPTRPKVWQRGLFHEGVVPDRGWRHLPACGCPACASCRGDDPASTTPRRAQEERDTRR